MQQLKFFTPSFLFIFWALKKTVQVFKNYFGKWSQTMAYERWQGEHGLKSQVQVTALCYLPM